MSAQSASLLERTIENLRFAWRSGGGARVKPKSQLKPDLPDGDLTRLRRQIEDCLAMRGGEVSARLRAADLAQAYLGLNEAGRERFLRLLSVEYGIDAQALEAAMGRLSEAQGEAERWRAEREMRQALVTPRMRLMTQFNALEGGAKFVVDLRTDLIRLRDKDIGFRRLDTELKDLLVSWFDVGFLELRRITWHSPAALLEKLIDYEAVHAIRSWDDLKNRLEPDRRCYAYFHPRMPEEPLIFVEVALVNGMSDNVQNLLDEEAPPLEARAADSAIFYSISNCQRGLAGVSFGNFLIKRVVDALARDLPNIRTFATLSPIPGLMDWLHATLESAPGDVLTQTERDAIQTASDTKSAASGVRKLLQKDGWHRDEEVAALLKTPLLRAAAQYLLASDSRDRALDRVAHFHFSNGARIERINWLGDTSENGLKQSAGIMVNYRYKLDEIEANHESYSESGKAAAHNAVKRLAKL